MSFLREISSVINYLLLIFVPCYCLYRLKKNFYSLINPSFYLLLLSYLYLTISSTFLYNYIYLVRNIEPWFTTFSDESIQTTSLICNWFTFVFLIFYIFSQEPKSVKLSFYPQKITYQIAIILTVLISIIFTFILIDKGGELQAIQGRHEALVFFSDKILVTYQYPYLLYFLLASLSVITWRSRNFKWYFVLIIPMITELLSRGRDLSFLILVYTYLNYVAISRKPRFLIITCIGLGLTATVFFRSREFHLDQIGDILIYLFGEIFATRLTTIITYDHFLASGNLGNFLLYSILNVFPSPITNFWVDTPRNYVYYLQDFYRYHLVYSNSGLAGNIASESLYYGGISFALITPIIIGTIMECINRLKIYQIFPGFIYCCFLIAKLRIFIRIGFYDSFFSLVTFMLFYLSWIVILEWNNKRISYSQKYYQENDFKP